MCTYDEKSAMLDGHACPSPRILVSSLRGVKHHRRLRGLSVHHVSLLIKKQSYQKSYAQRIKATGSELSLQHQAENLTTEALANLSNEECTRHSVCSSWRQWSGFSTKRLTQAVTAITLHYLTTSISLHPISSLRAIFSSPLSDCIYAAGKASPIGCVAHVLSASFTCLLLMDQRSFNAIKLAQHRLSDESLPNHSFQLIRRPTRVHESLWPWPGQKQQGQANVNNTLSSRCLKPTNQAMFC